VPFKGQLSASDLFVATMNCLLRQPSSANWEFLVSFGSRSHTFIWANKYFLNLDLVIAFNPLKFQSLNIYSSSVCKFERMDSSL
jgi:hypothetical protein